MPSEDTPLSPPYTPPRDLPAPAVHGASNPIIAVALGLVAACVLGIALFAASQFIYIYILYNSLVGVAIGWAIALGVQKGRYTNGVGLLLLTIVCSLIAYLVFNYSMYVWILRAIDGPRPSFLEFLHFRAENDTLIRGIKPGTIGNIIVWVVEAGITWFFAFQRVMSAKQSSHVEAVPGEVTEFVLYLMSQGRQPHEVDEELSRRGWVQQEDRERAMLAATALAAMIQEAQEEKT